MTKEVNFAFIDQYEELTSEETKNIIGGSFWGSVLDLLLKSAIVC